jgi:NAD(P)-dependent dehydrogenase (short-subunit alcohol dehydrogenase family)
MTIPRLELAGKTILITGASSGLGEHFALLSARAGARVVVAARRHDRLARLADAITAEGGAAQAVELDVADLDSIVACLDRAWPIDVLVNNAGIAEAGAALKLPSAAFDRVMNTNLRGPWLMATETARRWIAAERGGVIVNIASILGLRVAGGVAPYAISKAGIVQMTQALALEWARHGIRVNALAPGYLATELNSDFFQSAAGEALLKRVPMQRLGRLDELSAPFLLLAGDASSFMTGSILTVDGGHLVSSL